MKNHYKILLGILAITGMVGLYASQVSAATTTVVFTTNGTWTAPAGVTVVQVSGWAGGGSPSTSAAGTGVKGGGGGGAYSALNAFSVTPGNVYTVVVGKGGATGVGNPGTDSMFSASSTLLAKGGVNPSGATGGAGGAAASGFGDVTFSGGVGGNGVTSTSGGGGGGGAGTTGKGSAGSSAVAGSGTTIGGGTGGTGGTGDGVNGTAGSVKGGGGGGGSFDSGAGAVGARGEVDITYTSPPISGAVTIANAKVIIRNSKVIIQ